MVAMYVWYTGSPEDGLKIILNQFNPHICGGVARGHFDSSMTYRILTNALWTVCIDFFFFEITKKLRRWVTNAYDWRRVGTIQGKAHSYHRLGAATEASRTAIDHILRKIGHFFVDWCRTSHIGSLQPFCLWSGQNWPFTRYFYMNLFLSIYTIDSSKPPTSTPDYAFSIQANGTGWDG